MAAYQSYRSGEPEPSNPNAEGFTVLGGGVVGALLGAGVGTLVRTDRWERVDRSELETLLQTRGHRSGREATHR